MLIIGKSRARIAGTLFFLLTVLGTASMGWAGSFTFAGESNGVDLVTHPTGYTGTGGVLPVEVCIATTSLNQEEMEISVRNIITLYNQLEVTTGNIQFDWASSGGDMPDYSYDFESTALHELGHCLGMGHVNLSTESGLSGDNRNYTKSTDGTDDAFNINSGTDGIIGSADDTRGDDVNLNWFRMENNNPFTIADTVDSTTYARDTAFLPTGHNFAANGDRAVAEALGIANTETVMQQGTFNNEIQRTLTAEDVATLRYAMSGLDELASGTADNYTIQLTYGGVKDGCDVNLNFDSSYNGFASCSTGGSSISGSSTHVQITSADISFDPDVVNWYFNDTLLSENKITIAPILLLLL
ncbi:MAG: hypothetical protein SD837_10485 [Candidatus Electrothrix scaldis]|nr:MAG: hypothetical protein SD837_10485 [Candidatus Electrothrix sp. GW3-3]